MVILSMDVNGFSYETWYEMPVQLRRYYTKVIEEIVRKRRTKTTP